MRHYTRQAPDAPAFGSAAWLALPDGPAKIAAVVRAAEAWAMDGDDLQARLRAELEAARLADKRAEDAAWQTQGASHRAAYDGKSGTFRPDPEIAREVEQDWLAWTRGEVA
ncbi:hypothetical protein GCM10009562_39500 [Nocardioides aquaticus]